MALWGIHAGRTGDAEQLFLEKSVVALGWSKVGDLSGLPVERAAFRAKVEEAYGDTKKAGAIPGAAGMLFRFIHELKPGDLVLYPAKHGTVVRVGRVEGPYFHSADVEAGYPHRRVVNWFAAIDKAALAKDALHEINSALSFFQVKNHADEFVRALAEKGVDATAAAAVDHPEPPEAVRAVAFDHPPTLFKKVDYTLEGLLHYIDVGDIGLPDIQRPFVWSAAKVRDLFDSMYRGFPVGYLLFWENAAVSGAKAIGTEKKQHVPSRLIVDGQQRLTSLFAVFRGKPVLDDEFRESRIEIAFRPRDGKFEVADAAIRRDPEFVPSISALWADGRSSFGIVSDFLKGLETKRKVDPGDRDIIAKNLDRLFDIRKYPFTALEISAVIDEEAVADIFVRINSEGVKLNQADFILTLLSVFWDDGRKALESFARASRVPVGPGSEASPFNHFIQPGPDQLLRVAIALGFHRGRLKSVYHVLRGKDLETGEFSTERREQQFGRLRTAQEKVLDLTHWQLFLGSLLGAGFRSAEMVSSQTALLYAYAFFLLGRVQCGMDTFELQRLIGRWFFATTIMARYTSSPETVMDADLNRVRDLTKPDEFARTLEKILETALTHDFWSITLPSELESSSARSPLLFAYYAAQCRLGAPILFSDKRLADLLDPTVRHKKKQLERHHLFARALLEKQGVTDLKQVNQIANFAFLEWPDNIGVSDEPPSRYVPEMRKRFAPDAWQAMCDLHALPDGWETMTYEEFLDARRPMMAAVIRRGYDALAATSADEGDRGFAGGRTPDERSAWGIVARVELTLRTLIRKRFEEHWKSGADDQIQKLLGNDAWKIIERNREKHARQYPLSPDGGARDVLDYCYLGQLGQLIVSGDAWSLFKPLFKDKRQLEDLVAAIMPVRNDLAHFRAIQPKELQRCVICCDDLLGLVAQQPSPAASSVG